MKFVIQTAWQGEENWSSENDKTGQDQEKFEIWKTCVRSKNLI